MSDAAAFVAGFTEVESARVAFAWNGKHAGEFLDSNQEFRWAVAEYCLTHPEAAPVQLLEALFTAEAEWSKEAWGAPENFAELGALLLERGGSSVLGVFAAAFNRSFDTFGACHSMHLSRSRLVELSAAAETGAATATDETVRKQLTSARELFVKLADGSASEGWFTVVPG
jgi:hypothetical protein